MDPNRIVKVMIACLHGTIRHYRVYPFPFAGHQLYYTEPHINVHPIFTMFVFVV